MAPRGDLRHALAVLLAGVAPTTVGQPATQAASSVGAPATAIPAPASAPAGMAPDGGPTAAVPADTGDAWRSFLSVRLEDTDLPLRFAHTQGKLGYMLFQDGRSEEGLQCDGDRGDVAVESDRIAVRKLELLRVDPDSGILGLPFSWSAAGPQGPAVLASQTLRVTAAKVDVVEQDQSVTILRAELDPPIRGSELIVRDSIPVPLAIVYDCWQNGSANVQLRLWLAGGPEGQAATSQGKEVCMQWTKVCSTGWKGFEVREGVTEGDNLAFKDGAVSDSWSSIMSTEGTHDTVTKMRLSAPRGIVRLRPPTVLSSDTSILQASFVFAEWQDVEVDTHGIYISVEYVCMTEGGTADVTLTFEKAVLSGDHEPARASLSWKKICGDTAYRHLQVFLRSDAFNNKTQVASHGVAMEGFRRPCRSYGNATRKSTQACETGELILEIPPKDSRTSIELRLDKDKDTLVEQPSIQPYPDLAYDRKVLQATILDNQGATHTGGTRLARPFKMQAFSVRYTCFKDGVSDVMLTVHVLAHKPIELAWRKRCVEPKTHVGKALTAPQAMMIAAGVCLTMALITCCVCVFCGQDEKNIVFETYGYDGVARGVAGSPEDWEGTELSGRGRPGPARIGANQDEVTFH